MSVNLGFVFFSFDRCLACAVVLLFPERGALEK